MIDIYLIGFMGTGKTTIAHTFKREFGMELIETDELIEEWENAKISDIFAEQGEQYFRDLETQLLEQIESDSLTRKVISCGGGIVLRKENVDIIRKKGVIVLLTAKPDVIYERVMHSRNRPLLNNRMSVGYISELLERRRDVYEQAADIVVSTDEKDTMQICYEILRKIENKENEKYV